ncbi:hypothetical protein M2360_004403 [Rhizobium sp. SG_E_25_P2]|uniref:hypothetical protein n=1 Tax=Rhizobium sp. SG_E_25_P2 TaxID=2879942 RepID=UPI00247DA1D2|nr:hypothetical protein [Rhizobium sp. SG_E_25_P2]
MDANATTVATSWERLSYIKQMLAELSQVARAERADLLVYLIEMAFTEAGDMLEASPRQAISRETSPPGWR